MNRILNNRTRRLATFAIGALLASLFVISAQAAKPTPLCGADVEVGRHGVCTTANARLGAVYNTFNRFQDSISLCQVLGHGSGGFCTNTSYMDEREFVNVKKIPTRTTSGVKSTPESVPYFHDYTDSDLKKGDLVRAYIYVHNNASTIPSAQFTAKDVRVSLDIQGGRLVSTVKAKNSFVEEPSTAVLAGYTFGIVPDVEAIFTDEANVKLPSGTKLKFFSVQSGTIEGTLLNCRPGQSDCDTNPQFIGNPFQVSSSTSSVSGSSFSYSYGDLVGSKANAFAIAIDLQVVEGNDTTTDTNKERPGTYQVCVSGTPNLRFVWDNAQSGDVLTVLRTPNGSTAEETYTYTVGSAYGTIENNNLRNASGQALRVNAGDKIRWRVGKDNRFSGWYNYTVTDCMNLQDGLRIDYGRMVQCAAPNYIPYFAWNTPGATKKLDVSTDASFNTYWTKDISNLTTTTGPEGFSYFEPRTDKTLKFEGNVTYYWRIREEGKIYPGQAFRVPLCADRECDDFGYQGPNDTCTDDGKIIRVTDIVIDDTNKGLCGQTCACVELTANPESAGDFNTVTFTTTVTNKATVSGTITKRAEIYNKRVDGKKGYEIMLPPDKNNATFFLDETCTTGVGRAGLPCRTKEEGSFEFEPTSVKAEWKPTNRTDDIKVDLDAFKKDQTKPIIVYNLYPGDEVKIMVTGRTRTSAAGKEFAPTTDRVNYNYYMQSPSNNGVKKIVIARPFVLTINDGDVLTSTLLKGVSQLALVYQNTTGRALPGISGFEYGGTSSTSSQVKNLNLGFSNNLQGVTVMQATNKSASATENITSESDFASKLNIRPDQTRIFSTSKQNLVLGAINQKLELSQRSTIYVRDGNVTINGNIEYKTGNVTPSFALVVENGTIFIHPSVTRLDGVFIVLGNNAKISGTDGWQQYYETSTVGPKALVVNGALYGNIDNLIPSRPNVNVGTGMTTIDGFQKSSGISVNFDGRIYSFPPPGLKEIVGGVYELLRQ